MIVTAVAIVIPLLASYITFNPEADAATPKTAGAF